MVHLICFTATVLLQHSVNCIESSIYQVNEVKQFDCLTIQY